MLRISQQPADKVVQGAECLHNMHKVLGPRSPVLYILSTVAVTTPAFGK